MVVTACYDDADRLKARIDPLAGVGLSMLCSNRRPCRHTLQRPAAGVGVPVPTAAREALVEATS
jgi:hypothetical protein